MKKDLSEKEITARTTAFGDLLLAAMMDAAVERKMTQFKTELDPKGDGRMVQVRILVVPETMDIERPRGFQKES